MKENEVLDQLVRESKTDLVPPPKSAAAWDAAEAALMARVAEEAKTGTGRSRANLIYVGAAVLAAAAAVALFVGKDRETPAAMTTAPQAVEAPAGSFRGIEGAGEVRISGHPATPGEALRAGDVLEVDDARAVLERPRKVSWLLEGNTTNDAARPKAKASITAAGEALVLALDEGAIEAQVVPVPSGEAFAVDVGHEGKAVRVAVHGTHLRVTRHGGHVTVDLTEGVIAIGTPPRTGTTLGTTVTAPAHVELDVADLAGSIRIDHTPSAIRAPIPLGHHEVAVAAPQDTAVAFASPSAPTNGAAGAATDTPKETAPAATTHLAPPHPVDPGVVPPPAPKPVLPPREAIAQAVRDCAATKARASDVRVTITSSLRLKVGPDGAVESAQFDPPLLPEVQTCAAPGIYAQKLEGEQGAVTVPIVVSY
jgi:hypothetical protein